MYDIKLDLKDSYIQAETVYVWATIRLHSTGALATPATTITCTVYDPAKTATASAQTMTALSTGIYYYAYTLGATPIEGEYKALVTATTTGSIVSIGTGTFNVRVLP